VTFPMFAKIDVNGASAHPLYQFLTSQETKPDGSGDIKWNFAKFLIAKDGHVIARFAPPTDPSTPEFARLIDRALESQ
jgi:glutathione peroxidase